MAYQKQTFTDNVTVLNASMMKHIEDGIVAVETSVSGVDTKATQAKSIADTAKSTADQAKNTANAACPKTQAANKTTLGLVKQAAKVNNAVGTNVTKEEFNALLSALKTAGIMANA